MLPAKAILQDVCRKGLDWDDQLPPEEQDKWNTWVGNLPRLQDLTVERCLKPKDFGEVVSTQLHNFADASERGYGAVSYLRVVNASGDHHCAFLIGKSRLAPLKAMTIPRLELSAAVVATRLSQMIHRELDANIDETYFWTDSTVVLSYITNQDKRFHTFVANRISVIQDRSEAKQWHHVPTDLNPADDASRGLSADELINNERWINGPNFLLKEQSEWPKQPDTSVNLEDDLPEVKAEVKVTAVVSKEISDQVTRIIEYFSAWYCLKKCLAWILRYRKKHLRMVKMRRENRLQY